ncbi:aminotransferase class I/II-fold pyridoxal phosphate-dependent enzyme [Tabrizicola sp.]|uniref:aminotransferase class I/II-fold pyridoxal phosphate-dependent enzyme n=1 Tax=Tabrizicola sp. TaxID=2005166 RepID=UPI003F38D507
MLRPISSLAAKGPVDPTRDNAPIPLGGTLHRPGRSGLSFATQDYLGLASHPAVRAAALSAAGQNRSAPALALQTRVAAFLGLPRAALFPSGTDAIRMTLHALLRPGDDVIVDAGANSAMFETVLAAKAHLHRSPSGSVEAVERRLSRLARQRRSGQLFVAVSAISAHGSKIADLAELASLARTHGALLIADVTHDLGAMGQTGRGVMEIQGCLGRVDVVLGSFAKSFGAPGGFAAFRIPSHYDLLHLGQWRPAPLSPVNASTILAAFDIVDSPEGRRRRRILHGNALRLRNHLMADGIRAMGHPSPFVLVRLPLLTALPRTALLESAGPAVRLLQAPAVPTHAPRWRIQLTAEHGPADIDDLAELIRDVMRAFDRQPSPHRAWELV